MVQKRQIGLKQFGNKSGGSENWSTDNFLTIRQYKKNGQTILNNQLDKGWLAIANLKPTFNFLGFAK